MLELLWIPLLLILILGVLLVIFGFPGTWVIVAAVLAYSYFKDFAPQGQDWVVLLVVIGLALFGELIEFLVTIITAKRWNVPNGAIVTSFIGGIIGAAVGFPIFMIGSIIGMFIGAFIGTLIYGLFYHKDPIAALKMAAAALFSRGLALFFKVILTLMISIYILFKLF